MLDLGLIGKVTNRKSTFLAGVEVQDDGERGARRGGGGRAHQN